MKKIIISVLLAITTGTGFAVQAQVVAKQVTANFPSSVVLQVYEIAAKIKLDDAKQGILATHFAQADSLLAAAIIKGAVPTEITMLKNNALARFRNLLGAAQLDEYYTKCAKGNAERQAQASATCLRKRYGGDQDMEKFLYNINLGQNLLLAKTFLQYDGTDQLDNKLLMVLGNIDTSAENYTYLIKGNYFIKNKLALLNKIKPLGAKESDRLYNSYVSLCMQNNGRSYADNFNEAIHRTIRDTAYYAGLYANEITQQAAANMNRTLAHLVREKHVTKLGYDTVRYWVYAKERSLATLNQAFPTFSIYKDSMLQLLLRRSDSLISIALMKDGTFPFTTLFSTAIKIRSRLALRPGQIDTLMGHAVTMQQMDDAYTLKHHYGKFDGSAYEAQYISVVLEDDQYRLLLAEKNRAQAEKWAADDWTDILKRGLAESADSLSVVYQLFQYNTNRLVAKDRYANDKVMQNAYINDIDANMPLVMKKLKLARRKDNVVNATKEPVQAVTNTLKW